MNGIIGCSARSAESSTWTRVARVSATRVGSVSGLMKMGFVSSRYQEQKSSQKKW